MKNGYPDCVYQGNDMKNLAALEKLETKVHSLFHIGQEGLSLSCERHIFREEKILFAFRVVRKCSTLL